MWICDNGDGWPSQWLLAGVGLQEGSFPLRPARWPLPARETLSFCECQISPGSIFQGSPGKVVLVTAEGQDGAGAL